MGCYTVSSYSPFGFSIYIECKLKLNMELNRQSESTHLKQIDKYCSRINSFISLNHERKHNINIAVNTNKNCKLSIAHNLTQ
jgi:hypothetical protein